MKKMKTVKNLNKFLFKFIKSAEKLEVVIEKENREEFNKSILKLSSDLENFFSTKIEEHFPMEKNIKQVLCSFPELCPGEKIRMENLKACYSNFMISIYELYQHFSTEEIFELEKKITKIKKNQNELRTDKRYFKLQKERYSR